MGCARPTDPALEARFQRVRAKLIGPAWKQPKRIATAPVPIANRSRRAARDPALTE